jgi:hypothetical protein
MCELHDKKPLPDFQAASLPLPPGSRKKFCSGNGSTEEPYLAPFLPRVSETPRPTPATQRKKLWELDRYYHCSVIGTCLTLAELRQIQRRLGGVVHALNSDYDVHRVFVSAVREATAAGRLIHKFLDRKYKPAIQQLGKARTAEEFTAYWDTALASGEVAGAYWALITQAGVPYPVLERIYGEVHMLSHLSGASIRVDLQELNRLRRRCPELEGQLIDAKTTARRRLAEQQNIIDALNQRLAQTLETERQIQAAEARLAMVEGLPLVERLTAAVEDLTAWLAAERARAERAEAAAETWRHRRLAPPTKTSGSRSNSPNPAKSGIYWKPLWSACWGGLARAMSARMPLSVRTPIWWGAVCCTSAGGTVNAPIFGSWWSDATADLSTTTVAGRMPGPNFGMWCGRRTPCFARWIA